MSEETQPRNPLLDWAEVQHIADWKHWRELWDSTFLTEFRHSLLHFGFEVPANTQKERLERICFYLATADNHAESKNLETPVEKQSGIPIRSAFNNYRTTLGYVCHPPSELRQKIARKAFEVLCLNFFRDQRNPNACDLRQPAWTEDVFQGEVFSALLWFLRTDEYGSLINADWRHNDNHLKTFRDFALKFCKVAWEYRDTARPQLVQILVALDKIEVLLIENDYPMNKPDLLMLKKLAMSRSLHIPNGHGESDYRKPKYLVEAVAGQSPIARVFDTLLSIHWVRRRSRRAFEIARKKRELEEQLARLGS